ncbi:Lrp/AsnC family transcriptional regulator [Aggregatibacter kilianii]|uniref:Lrp/AsnC family transcriptional regulator n=1 Tax=Aggregatibacter kilianii TaxID=2025884 RepID=UPI0019550792|nr:Lrp/AsnC family transcriptional regulator [Aggregatibacter kilianii]
MDYFDKKILTELQKDNRISQRDLAYKINLSASAINRRIAAMEKAGIIKNSVTLVDAQKVGRPITVIAEVTLDNERLDLLEEAKKRFVKCPQIQQVYYVTGEFDFLLIFSVRDMAEYEQLTRELFFASGNIKHFRTLVSLQNAKQELAVIVE